MSLFHVMSLDCETVLVSFYLLHKACLYLVSRKHSEFSFLSSDSTLRTDASMDGPKRKDLPLNAIFNYTTFETKKQPFQSASYMYDIHLQGIASNRTSVSTELHPNLKRLNQFLHFKFDYFQGV